MWCRTEEQLIKHHEGNLIKIEMNLEKSLFNFYGLFYPTFSVIML